MTTRPFTVGIIQDSASSDQQATLDQAVALVRDAASRGAQIICLKELFNAPYFCKSQKCERFDIAEPIPGPTTAVMQKLARELEVVLVVPLFERQASGVYRNSAAIIDADGSLLGVYRKMHIPDDPLFNEKYYFTPGDAAHDDRIDQIGEIAKQASGFRVWKTRYATIGVLICWDQWYPEAARITSLLGADILFYPTAIGWHPAEKSEFGAAQVDAWRTIQRSHAIANGVFVASPNRIGHEDDEPGTQGIEFFGHSFIADPFGRLIADAPNTDETILIATCDPKLIEETRRNWPFLRDRRIDAYAPILSRYLGA
jgi:N-carbamoylputrescine amidase